MKDLISTVAENIRARRKELGYTQKQLADKLQYSEKAVSKWENAQGLPPTVVLPLLAKALDTDIDSLMEQRSDVRYYLGIDGGGTKTEFVLADTQGNTVKRVILGACNPNDVGLATTLDVFRNGISQVCGNIPYRYISVFAGFAGGATGDYRQRVLELLEPYHFARYDCGNDAQNCVAVSLMGRDGISVIMGTGSIAYVQKDGELSRVGGWGYLLGDGGSGFALGQGAILAALQDEDGSGRETLLRALVSKKCGAENVFSKVSEFYVGGKRVIASYAGLIFEAYEQGDAVAEEILRSNMKDIAKLIRGGAKRLPTDRKVFVALCGGITNFGQIIVPMIEEYLDKDKYEITVCDRPIVNGALMLAGLKEETL